MEIGAITSHIDVAQVVLYTFWIFFAGLIYYLRREDRREGYPLESEVTGAPDNSAGLLWVPEPKVFLLPDGGVATAPHNRFEPKDIKAEPFERWSGAPLVPTDDPMLAGVGPGAYAQRADVPNMTLEGHPNIVPMRASHGFTIAEGDTDPRGFAVMGADGKQAGTVRDVWVDQAEALIRFIEVELPGQSGADSEGDASAPDVVLLPMTLARIHTGQRRKQVLVNAILSHQFAKVPRTKHPEQVTLLEEDKIYAYYGAGTLYAEPSRQEPLL
jgi:photosynthetic reaction center H subunit